MSSNPVNGQVYSIQHYVIKFVIDLRQVGGFLRVEGVIHPKPKPQKKEFPILEVSKELAISCTCPKPVLDQIIEIRIPIPLGKKNNSSILYSTY
jgi:hypothetical protein